MFLYFPPQGSHFYDEVQINGMDLLEDIFVRLFNFFLIIFLIMGDLNYTGNLPDFQVFDDNVHVLNEYKSAFDTYNLPRAPYDRHVTRLGQRFLSFCQLYAIYVLTGWLGHGRQR